MTHSPDISEVAKAIKLVQSMDLKARRDETGEIDRLCYAFMEHWDQHGED